MPKLSIIVPVYNGGDYIYDNIKEFTKTFSDMGLDYEPIVVDDGSTDNTYEEACKVNSKNVRVLGYPKNQGKGHALQYGVKYASGDLVTFIDADLDLHPEQISTFIEYMNDNGSDIVIGSKRHPLSRVDYPLKRRILSNCYHLFIAMLFRINITDTQAGLKLLVVFQDRLKFDFIS
jgi:glycosyltransferase involved in cell wall biosynthesis